MNGKITVKCAITKDFSGELVVRSRAIVKNLKTTSAFGKNYGDLQVKPKYEVKFDTLQYLASLHNKMQNLDDKGGITFENLDANYFYSKKLNSDEVYYAIRVNLGTNDKPMPRTFYLSAMQQETLKTMKLEYQFDEAEYIEETNPEEDED